MTNSPNPTAHLAFRWPWRPYQARVLDAIDLHIADRRLHIVAAPGSGKTTLGLEVFRQLDKPALVLSPTRTIRDQWLKRLRDYLPPDAPWPPEWASTDWHQLGFFTSVTYQALHTEYRAALASANTSEPVDENGQVEEDISQLEKALNDEEVHQLIDRLKAAHIGTLILDEAHHLRAEWWKALNVVVEALPDLHLVALTATPPYDVVGHEWTRYQELCGPIDEEISVPELVKAGTLCPHQDYVYVVAPTENEQWQVRQYEGARRQLFADLLADATFQRTLNLHPLLRPDPSPEIVLDDPELAAAVLSYQKMRGDALHEPLLKLLGVQAAEVPVLHPAWWQKLVRSYLYSSHWPDAEWRTAHRDDLAKRLRRDDLLYRRELRLDQSRPVQRTLSLSSAKLQAVVNIHQLERRVRGDGLRQVVLTDFIRDDGFDNPDWTGPHQLGAWPIFHQLVPWLDESEASRVALLTGRLVIIHQARLAALQRLCPDCTTTPLQTRPGFVRVSTTHHNDLVDAFTRLLLNGELHVIIGTRALLGEGWDAPALNSLVLASFVGSFMLTNQMRGRAIRVDPDQPNKAASIWHIATIDPSQPSGLDDWHDLQRRFQTFVGLAANAPRIESGLQRLDLPQQWHNDLISEHNTAMEKRLQGIGQLKARWQAAIFAGAEGRVLPAVQTSQPPRVGPYHFTQTLAYLLTEAAAIFAMTVLYGLQNVQGMRDLRTMLWFLLGLVGVGFVIVLPWLVRAAWLSVRHFPVDGSLRQIAFAVRDALCQLDLIQTNPRRLGLVAEKMPDGAYAVSLSGGTFYEQSLFADCLDEVLRPIENPRYLITREDRFWQLRRTDYHAVPYVLATNKERAQVFHHTWQRRVGPSELIYTRSGEGRQALLKARGQAFSGQMAHHSERRDRWQ